MIVFSQIFRFVFLGCLWALLLGAYLGLSDQEAYYWIWSKKLELCYVEHPPLQAWITHLFTYLFGNSAWVIRLPAALGRIVGFYYFVRWSELRLGRQASHLAVMALLSSFFVVSASLLALPDSVLF
jgi:4-amino-4-deoxy-L-arabinose transferase-like glycosyltransferase